VEYLVLAASAAALSLLLTPLVRAAARRVGAVDDPGPRRVHVRPTPRLGGLAVLAAVLGALALDRHAGGGAASVLAAPGRTPALLVAGFATVLATGVVDDLVGLRWRPSWPFRFSRRRSRSQAGTPSRVSPTRSPGTGWTSAVSAAS
jgi:UDP-N-acetylmuramyl pentapeptide phosphotransferase/UDP-N-acetylglucosamine-1-phosphate transferase